MFDSKIRGFIQKVLLECRPERYKVYWVRLLREASSSETVRAL